VAIDHFHLIDASMALHTTDATIDMRGVVEIAVVGKLVHLDPLDGQSRLIRASDLRQLRALAVDLSVAVHAGLSWWNRCKGCALHRRVAVAAVEPELPDMQRVAVWNRLGGHVARIDRLGTESVCDDQNRVQRHDRPRHEDEWQDLIRPAGKKESAHGVMRGSGFESSRRSIETTVNRPLLCDFFHKLFAEMNVRTLEVVPQRAAACGNEAPPRL